MARKWRLGVMSSAVEQTDDQAAAGEYPQIIEVRGELPPQYPELESSN